MRQTMRLILGILLLTSVSAFGGSFSNLQVSLTIAANSGSGGNLGGSIVGPGINLLVGGGTAGFFNGPGMYLPGSSSGGGAAIFWDFADGQLGSQNYTGIAGFAPFPYLQLDISSLTSGSFTFPTNRQNFTITVPASLGIVTGTIVSDCNVCQTFVLSTVPGQETLSFQYFPDFGYYFVDASFTSTAQTGSPVPEPGTMGLMATGMGAVTWRRLKRKVA